MGINPLICEKHSHLSELDQKRMSGDRCPVCLWDAYYAQSNYIEQTLGRALGYPWYKDDQKNFPGSTDEDGVCVGDHVAESIAAEAAHRIELLREEIRLLSHVALSAVALRIVIEYGGTPHLHALNRDLDAHRDWKDEQDKLQNPYRANP